MGVGLGLAVEEAANTGKADESTSDDLLKGIVPPVASNVGVVRGEVGGDGAGLGFSRNMFMATPRSRFSPVLT
jgi:hypothetical protein